jgi:[acyl-carrier-protein] S-malonyltransferase
MARAILFPGQGSQAIGMGRDLAQAFPVARQVFEEVDDALDQRLSRLVWDGADSDLALTENAQPALMTVSVAVVRVIEAESGRAIETFGNFVAGHSLGEYSALAAVRSLTLGDAARLLRLRGQAMQRAVPVGEGAMAALLGVELDVAREIAAAAAETDVCAVANDNGAGQVVLSGHIEAIDRAIALAAARGIKRAIKLPVSAPFHCSLMGPAQDVMADALGDVTIAIPALPLIANVAAEPVNDPARIRDLLIEQVTGMVRWRESMERLGAMGVDRFVEVGAGKVLTGLAKRIIKDAMAMSVSGPADIDGVLTEI